jgi:predicted lipid-binding transport protein (Tim44 family)
VIDIYTIIFLALAVFIFVRLRSVLGTRTGQERNPFEGLQKRGEPPAGVRVPPANDGKVVPLPTRDGATAQRRDFDGPPADRWKGIAEAGSPIAAGLDQILAADPGFDAGHFVTGAKAAYEMIVGAFAEGDTRALRPLLSKEVFESFEGVIRDRQSRGETVESRFVAISRADIVGAEMRGRQAHLTLRFVSQLVTATRDRSGTVVDGSTERVMDVTDVWTFSRDINARDPNWRLVATEEEH